MAGFDESPDDHIGDHGVKKYGISIVLGPSANVVFLFQVIRFTLIWMEGSSTSSTSGAPMETPSETLR